MAVKESRTNWIWIPKWEAEDKEKPALLLFRKKVILSAEPSKAVICISADTRYKLYINGKMVEMGPSRGDHQIWYYDEIDISEYLKMGGNLIAVQVLRYPTEHYKGNYGMFRTEYPGLYLSGNITDVKANHYSLSADETWKCKKDKGFSIVSEVEAFAPLQIYENRVADPNLKGWMEEEYEDDEWLNAKSYLFLSKAVSPGNLQARTIPFLYRKAGRFKEVTVVRNSAYSKEEWEKVLTDKNILCFMPFTKEIVEISAGEEMTGYLHLRLRGGKGTKINILQSESYVQRERNPEGLPVKKRRDDWENGYLEGFTDVYEVAGYGTKDRTEEYEPFWFRTFRYIRLEIAIAAEPLILEDFFYTETGYPLDVQTEVKCSEEVMSDIWEISERSLRRCMHESYEDCPFYEQLQYAMDARSEILYTYAISADDRLARKCMDDFRRSQFQDGMLNSCYPCFGPNIIPGFSIYYILMLYDHMMYFGDALLLDEHLPTVEKILNFFHYRRTSEGYVGKVGGPHGKEARWSFVDWVEEWNATRGVPLAIFQGPITMESLLYIYGLQKAAEIAEYLNRKELAEIYSQRAVEVQEAVRQYCKGEKEMLTDGPRVYQYSQHVQVFAVLTRTINFEQAKKNLEQTLLFPEKYPQCSVAMAFYLFRALQETGLYRWTEKYWQIWKRMLEKGATTCIEDEIGERSDCHAWGSLILYELPSVILGVKPLSPGYSGIEIHPCPVGYQYAGGKVVTPKGLIRVSWDIEKGEFNYDVPLGMKVNICLDDFNRELKRA